MQTQNHDSRSASSDCYVALELSRRKWLLIVLHPTQELEPAANPERFTIVTTLQRAFG